MTLANQPPFRCGLGTDIIEIDRFTHWQPYHRDRLIRLFTPHELTYAFSNPTKTAERLAVRFAAREACYKAVHHLLPHVHISFFTVLRNVHVTHTLNGAPQLVIDWSALSITQSNSAYITVNVSLSHTRTMALAMVMLVMRN